MDQRSDVIKLCIVICYLWVSDIVVGSRVFEPRFRASGSNLKCYHLFGYMSAHSCTFNVQALCPFIPDSSPSTWALPLSPTQ